MADHYPGLGCRAPADLVNRQFAVERPNALWVADFTYLRCGEGTAAVICGAWSR